MNSSERFPTGGGFLGPPRPSSTRGGAGRTEARTSNDAHAARAPKPLKTFSLKNPSRQRERQPSRLRAELPARLDSANADSTRRA